RLTRRATETENKPVMDMNTFPNALPLGLPGLCQLGAIHYALERFTLRGQTDEFERIDAILRTEAEYYADGARRAVHAKNAAAAHELARLAHSYILAMSARASRAGFEDVEALAAVSQ